MGSDRVAGFFVLRRWLHPGSPPPLADCLALIEG